MTKQIHAMRVYQQGGKPASYLLSSQDAKNLTEYARALAMIQKAKRDRRGKEEADVRGMGDEDIEAIVVKAAERIRGKPKPA